MKSWLGCATIAAIAFTPAPADAEELRLSIANGRVTLVAQDVTVKQILDEWSRLGQTTIVGAERLSSASVSLELKDVSEGSALESLLRSASGYIAKPRTTAAGASTYDRILIMPTSRPPAVSPTPAPFANRAQPPIAVPPVVEDDEPEPNPIMPPGSVPPPQQFPGQPPQPGMQPGMTPPMTSPRPGQLPMPGPSVPGYPPQVPGSNLNGFPQQPAPPVPGGGRGGGGGESF
jgi:hypothetical protein